MAVFTYEYDDQRPSIRITTTPPASAIIAEEGTLYLSVIGVAPELVTDGNLRETVETLGSLFSVERCDCELTDDEFAHYCKQVAEHFVHERGEVICLGCGDLVDVSNAVGVKDKDVMCPTCARTV